MTWLADVEVWSSETMLYVPALPGLFAKGGSVAECLAIATAALDPFLDWLVADELLPDRPTTGEIIVRETVPGTDATGPLFASDRLALDQELIELGLAVGRAAISDLLYLLDEADGASRAAVEQNLRHVAELDRWYATRLLPGSGHPFPGIEDEVVQSASFFEETIDAAVSASGPDERIIDGEIWTIGKVMRRRTVHLREHVADVLALTQER